MDTAPPVAVHDRPLAMADAASASLAKMSLDGFVEVPNTVESKKPYYEKRVKLFEEYRAREAQNVEKV